MGPTGPLRGAFLNRNCGGLPAMSTPPMGVTGAGASIVIGVTTEKATEAE